jgi:hypothetical protein
MLPGGGGAARASKQRGPWHAGCYEKRGMEIFSLALVVGFFALSWGLIELCERLLE